MRVIEDSELTALHIPDRQYVQWVREAFLTKPSSLLPKKTSITFDAGSHFVNTMPCVLGAERVFGVKLVSRYPKRTPTIQGHILVYDLDSGSPIAMLEAAHITEQRTGAVAALAAETLEMENPEVVAVMGLGVAGRAFLRMYAASEAGRTRHYRLLMYKDQAESAAELLYNLDARSVSIVDSPDELVADADLVVSAVTVADSEIVSPSQLKPGVTLIPIHTRGFQSCDTLFDKVFADDRGHVEGFQFFSDFRSFGELGDVLRGTCNGRTAQSERILSYNIGIALHDILIASRLCEMLDTK